MSTQGNTKKKEYGISWFLIMWYINLHFYSIYGIILAMLEAKWMTLLFAMFITMITFIGVTVGAHRYYAHRTFVASTPLRIFFIIAHTLAGVGSMYNWVLLHRMHHKYYKTDKDPYNHDKGFIYSHFLSNIKNKFLKDKDLVKSIDMRDIDSDGYAWFQHKFYSLCFLFVTIIFPINIPIAYWNESMTISIFVVGFLRLFIACHMSWLVNSAQLVWGLRPEEKYPVNDFSVFYVERSFWVNYHYFFSRDWKSSEYGNYNRGLGTLAIKFFYELHLATMLTTASSKDIEDILYKLACKKNSLEESLMELERLGEEKAIKDNLRYYP